MSLNSSNSSVGGGVKSTVQCLQLHSGVYDVGDGGGVWHASALLNSGGVSSAV